MLRYDCVTKSDTFLFDIIDFDFFCSVLLKNVKTVISIPYIRIVVILGCGDNLNYFEFLTLKRLDRGVSFFALKVLDTKKLPFIFIKK